MRAAVLGHPIAHSLSPVLHRAAYAALGLDWRYDAIDVTADGLPAFVAGLDASWAGLSLTMPLKAAVLPLLDEAAPLVARVGGANTVVFSDGRRVGHNTDVFGVGQAVRSATPDLRFSTVGIVGAGSTASAALVAASDLATAEIRVSARRHEAAVALASSPGLAVPAVAMDWDRLADVLASDCVIVTLPGDAAAPLAELVPERPGVLLDVTYDPWPTTLAVAWQASGGLIVPGHQMLLWQAAAQVELMTGQVAPVAAMAAALHSALAGPDF